jgi:hypothetical protein
MKMLEEKFNIVINIPITGGEAQDDTLNGMKYIIETFQDDNVSFNIWINEFFGKVTQDNRPFEAMEIYQQYREPIHGIFILPQVNARTFGEDLRKMHKAKQIFNEVLEDPNYTLMEKQRLIGYKNKIFDSIALIIG